MGPTLQRNLRLWHFSRKLRLQTPHRSVGSVLRATLAGLCVGIALAKLACVGYASPGTTNWGQPVVDIRINADARLSPKEFAGQITQKTGEPLEPSKVAESLKNLYATGRFRELRADIEEAENGVVLIFVARAQFFVGIVRMEGTPKPLEPAVLVSASRLRLGQPLFDQDLVAALKYVGAVLAENGYYQAQIQHQVLRNTETQEADIIFSLVPGRAARLSGVEFLGHTLVSPARLAAVAHWRTGVHLTSAKLESGLFKIHSFYVKLGRLEATAGIQKRTYNPPSDSEKLVVQVEAGPEVRVRVQGARIPSSKLKQILPIYREGATDDLALREGERKLEDYFERQGDFSAKARVERNSPDPQRLDITYTVTLGPRGEFVGYAFKGNKSVPTEDLAATLEIQPKDFPRLHGLFNRALLDHDVKAVKTLYQSRGFLEARVSPLVNERFENQPGRLFVTFDIEEGPQTKVGQLVLRSLDADLEKRFRASLLTRPGQPFSPARAQADRDSILSYFADQGYSRTTVSWNASPVSSAHEVSLEYKIDSGSQEKIRRIIFMGNTHTRDGIIDRELTFDEDEPLSQSNLLESQQRLYDLGVFNQVQIAAQDPESSETAKTVLVNVEEARRWTVGYGGGIDVQRLESSQPEGQYKASPRVSLDVSRLNVGGRPQTFTLRGRFSNLERVGATSYLIPHFLARKDLNFRINGLVDRTRDVLTFTAEHQEGSVSIQKQYSATTSLLGRYSYRRVEVIGTPRISPEQIPLLSRPVRVAMVGSSYVNDHRDNPADATKGSYSLADAGIAWNKLGSEANFLRISGQNATYYHLRPHLIFARNTRLGVESTFGGLRKLRIAQGPQAGQVIFSREIPLPERFFMGGSESHRGFSLNQAGPRDPVTGFPLGGNALLLNTLELRMPFEENRFGFVLFHDAGNVYSAVRKMRLFKFSQGSPTNFDYTVHAVGMGLRYQTPVGPLRFDVSYSLNSPRFQVRNHQSLEVRQLPHVQFFLSVGQSF